MSQYFLVEDLVEFKNDTKLKLDDYIKKIDEKAHESYPDCQRCFLKKNFSLNGEQNVFHNQLSERFDFEQKMCFRDICYILYQHDFSTYYTISKLSAEHFDFDPETRNYTLPEDKLAKDTLQFTMEQEEITQADLSIQKKQFSKNNNTYLLDIIRTVPTLSIDLNEDQMKVIVSKSNVLCLGRSGTGKTTICVLRFFTQELHYKALIKEQ
jgi:transcriptional regulator with GAF, ATPase, and Fis domain